MKEGKIVVLSRRGTMERKMEEKSEGENGRENFATLGRVKEEEEKEEENRGRRIE